MRKDNKYAFNDSYYKRSFRNAVEGSAARELEIEEDFEEEVYEDEYEEVVEEPARRREYQRKPEQIREVYKKEKVKRKYQYNFFASLMLIASMGILFYFAADYIQQQSNLNRLEKSIKAAQATLNDITEKNIALMNQLDKEVDRNLLYTVAVSQFGMQYPTDNQIVFYQTPDQGYVKQYGEIPITR